MKKLLLGALLEVLTIAVGGLGGLLLLRRMMDLLLWIVGVR
jgi:hypothetical protein